MVTRREQILLLVVASLVAGGCANDAVPARDDQPSRREGTHGPAPAPAPLAMGELGLTLNPWNVLSLYADWKTDEPATSRVSVLCDDATEFELSDRRRVTRHEAFVMALPAGTTCQITARSFAESGRAGEITASWTVPELPQWFPESYVRVHEGDRVQSGWTLLNLTNQVDAEPLVVAIVDSHGAYRWYWQSGTSAGDASEVRAFDDGVLVAESDAGVRFVTWTGNVLWEKSLAQHHDIRPFGDDRWIFLGLDFGCPNELSDFVGIWNQATDDTEWTWHLCEHYAPTEEVFDWSHLNAVEPYPDASAVLLSSRNQDALFKVRLDDGAIEWILGSPPDHEPDDIPVIELAEDDRFYAQHAPEIQDDGTIVLFDNGRQELRPYSRVLQIEVDEETMTARAIRDLQPELPIFTHLWGDADVLANGNVLSVWASRMWQLTRLIEFAPDDTVVWDVALEERWGVYRADRLARLPLGLFIEE